MSYLDLPANQNPLWAKFLALADAKNGAGLSVDEIANFVKEAAKAADNLHKVLAMSIWPWMHSARRPAGRGPSDRPACDPDSIRSAGNRDHRLGSGKPPGRHRGGLRRSWLAVPRRRCPDGVRLAGCGGPVHLCSAPARLGHHGLRSAGRHGRSVEHRTGSPGVHRRWHQPQHPGKQPTLEQHGEAAAMGRLAAHRSSVSRSRHLCGLEGAYLILASTTPAVPVWAGFGGGRGGAGCLLIASR